MLAPAGNVLAAFCDRDRFQGLTPTMLDKRFIRDNPDAVKEAVRVKGVDLDVDELLALDKTVRKLQHEFDDSQARKRALSKQFAQADPAHREELRVESNDLDDHLKQLRDRLDRGNALLNDLLLLTPNIPWDKAPVGPTIAPTSRSGPGGRSRSSTSGRWTTWS
jgi:seryl-tRNA synthetase